VIAMLFPWLFLGLIVLVSRQETSASRKCDRDVTQIYAEIILLAHPPAGLVTEQGVAVIATTPSRSAILAMINVVARVITSAVIIFSLPCGTQKGRITPRGTAFGNRP
jgi:hypothetical protein